MKKNLFRFITLSVAMIAVLLYAHAFANQADIDSSFDIKMPVGLNNGVTALAAQSDGKIIIGGYFTKYKGLAVNSITRLYADGTKDYSFNNGGAGFNNIVQTIKIQSDGKIIIGGDFTTYNSVPANRITRLNINGTIDSSFTIGAGANAVVKAMAIETGGKIIIGGSFTSYDGTTVNKITRINTDGTIDNSFTIGAGFIGDVYALTIQNDGKIVVGGSFTSYDGTTVNKITRLNANGTLDNSFTIGSGFDGNVNTLAIQTGDKIVVGGDFTNYNGTAANKVARLNADGTMDNSLVTGTGFNANIQNLAVQNDGKIVALGFFTNYSGTPANFIARINADGTLDNSFVTASGFDQWGNILLLQSDGKIIAGGGFQSYNGASANYIIRLNAGGTRDVSFNLGDGFSSYINTLATQSDGKIIVGGTFTNYNGLIENRIVRLNTDGTKDNSFNSGIGSNNNILILKLQSDGKIIIGGWFTSYDGTAANRIARLNANGTLDSSFTIGSGFNNLVYALAIQNDGKIVVGGNFTDYNGSAVNRIVRLNTDGTRDASFTIGAGFGGLINTLAIQSDGKIIAGGAFTTYSGSTTNRIIRLNTNGTKDASFTIGAGFASTVYSLAIETGGKIIVGGTFTTYSGAAASKIARLNTNGTKDASFTIGVGFNNIVNALAIQNDGKIIAGGIFTSYSGATANRIIRLNADGTKDSPFNVGVGFDNNVNALAIQNDGKIIVGGAFINYNGAIAGYLTALYGQSDIIIIPNSLVTGDLITEFTSKGYVQSGGDLSGSKSFSLVDTDGSIPVAFTTRNQNIELSLPAGIQFKKSDNVTNYSGLISVPVAKSVSSVNNKAVISAFKVGSNTEGLKLAGGVATLLVPAPGRNIGDPIDAYYSEDNGRTWNPQTTTSVINNNGQPYVLFTTDHFTDFAITLGSTGSFVINNDAASTATTSVTLNVTGVGITDMAFSNDNVIRSSPVPFAASTAWTLSAGTGLKTVYAQFNAGALSTNDTIMYDIPGSGGCTGSSCGDITLEIVSSISGYCEIGDSVDFGITGYSASTRTLESGFTTTSGNNARFCNDLKGKGTSRTLDISSTDLFNITTNNALHTIASNNVSIKNPAATVVQGVCTPNAGSSLNGRTSIGGVNVPLLGKIGGAGEVCKISTSQVDLKIDIPAYQALGQYSGTLTITVPDLS